MYCAVTKKSTINLNNLMLYFAIAAVGFLSALVDVSSRRMEKSVQTEPCPYLDAKPLVVAEESVDGNVITGE